MYESLKTKGFFLFIVVSCCICVIYFFIKLYYFL
nr:MAG TPA: hypothetical protein [Caudoviricetes sp.]